MSRTARVIWDDALTSYNFGPSHPLAPVRVELTMALARELGVLDKVEVAGCEPAGDDELAMVHDRGYIEAVKRVSATGAPDLSAGLGTADNPAFVGVHEASALIAGASLAAARAVWEGTAEHAVNVAGGLHHAMAATASGFCVYNDPALAIAWLLRQGATRVAYVDVDVHHGDGVQAAFYDDPRVLTISLHESPRTLFPGTGFAEETGAEGTAVNVALPAGCGDTGWLRAFDAVVPPLLREFRPEILVTQHGCDSHALDPLANLMLSIDGQRTAYAALHRLAHETAGGRWIVTGGGGYELVQVVPRAWTHLIAEVAGHPLDPATPTGEEWRRLARERTGETPPLTMTDGRNPEFRPLSGGYDPGDPIDRAIMATRKAVFPLHGLDPMP
ncbi:acetoin utilization protein AcuC [Nonomuraea sp. 3-1Str]|uniref:acetoin utilization protein AcuC n=1 Tax=Nonomuraea sp. 3-1Str TaxID=2929801 RepID=UPI00285B892E|nr:acetoin utilization protein AcuC [Nonomuraea sp. 3-1Str]MDR8407596.1 acetoin utilization protein AcuC [Nonomuraea sp. 3-1Str]